MTSERTRRLKYIRQGPLYSNLQWNREPILLSSRANLCGTVPLNTTSTAAEIATEVLGRRLTHASTGLELRTYMKVVLRMESTMLTICEDYT